MYKVIVFGDLPLATKVCEFLLSQNNIKLIGVVIGNSQPKNNDPFPNTPLLSDFANKKNIRSIKFEQLTEIFNIGELNYGITCRFSKILTKKHIEIFSNGVINFHGGLLPECGGLYSSVHSILEGDKTGGGTIHWLDEKIDTGDIIKRCEVEINEYDTSYSVFQKTQQALLQGFIDIFEDVINSKITPIKQLELISQGQPKRYFDKSSLNDKREIDLQELIIEPTNVMNKIRAFDFPGYEPAYILLGGKKVYLRINNA